MNLRIQCFCVDATEPAALADFWQQALGWRRTHADVDEVVLEPPAGTREDGVVPDLLFLRVPEDKAGENRLHLDLRPGDQAAGGGQARGSRSEAGRRRPGRRRQLDGDGRPGRQRVLRAAAAHVRGACRGLTRHRRETVSRQRTFTAVRDHRWSWT